MYQKLLALFVISLYSISCIAQDVLYTTSGESISALIQEIGLETVSYKEADFKEGPLRLQLVSELDSIVLQNGMVHRFENKAAKNNHNEVQIKTTARTIILDINGGAGFFVNNLYKENILVGPGGQLKFAQQFSKSMSYYVKANICQSSSAFEETDGHHINTLNTMLTTGISGGIEYNFIPYSDKSESKKVKWHPHISVGFGFTAGINDYYADVMDESGNVYYYWDDGLIRNVDQSSPATDDVRIIERDYKYETRLNEGAVVSYAISVPIELGLRVRITNRFGLNLALSTSTDILLNDVSAIRNNENRFNFQMLPSIGVSIFID